MSPLVAWQMRRGAAKAQARYRRSARRLAASPYGWDGWLDLMADAARLVSETTDDADTEMWAERGELVRRVAAAQRGHVLLQVRHEPAVWDQAECLALWQELARADDDDQAATALDELFLRLAWSSVPDVTFHAALVLAELATARRSAGRVRKAMLASAVAEMTSGGAS